MVALLVHGEVYKVLIVLQINTKPFLRLLLARAQVILAYRVQVKILLRSVDAKIWCGLLH